MRILIKHPTTSAETVLCDRPARGLDRMVGPLEGVPIRDQIAAQVAPRLRAETVLTWNRKNKQIQISFKVAREMASLNAAAVWQVAFHAACLREGVVHFIEADAAGTETRFTLSNALITDINTTPLGVTRIVEFAIIGGALA